jgi:hypothetical protein
MFAAGGGAGPPVRDYTARTSIPFSSAKEPKLRQVEEWVFQGIEIREPAGCITNPVVTTRHTWLRRGPGYEAARTALRNELRQQHGSLADISTFTVTRGRPAAIALVRKTLRCTRYNGPPTTIQSYRWHKGLDQASVLAELESNKITPPGVLGFEVVRWIDLEGELNALGAAPNGFREVVTRMYGPVEVRFTAARLQSGRTVVHMRARNTDPHVAAVVRVLATSTGANGQPRLLEGAGNVTEVIVRPGEQMSGPIPAQAGFEVQVQMRTTFPDQGETNPNRLRNWVRDTFFLHEGKMRPKDEEHGNPGVRG